MTHTEPYIPNPLIETMQDAVGSMEEQLISLYSERQLLEDALGRSDAQEILSLVGQLKEMIGRLEIELATAAADRQIFAHALGTSDAREIVALLKGTDDVSIEIS